MISIRVYVVTYLAGMGVQDSHAIFFKYFYLFIKCTVPACMPIPQKRAPDLIKMVLSHHVVAGN